MKDGDAPYWLNESILRRAITHFFIWHTFIIVAEQTGPQSRRSLPLSALCVTVSAFFGGISYVGSEPILSCLLAGVGATTLTVASSIEGER